MVQEVTLSIIFYVRLWNEYLFCHWDWIALAINEFIPVQTSSILSQLNWIIEDCTQRGPDGIFKYFLKEVPMFLLLKHSLSMCIVESVQVVVKFVSGIKTMIMMRSRIMMMVMMIMIMTRMMSLHRLVQYWVRLIQSGGCWGRGHPPS